jgi:CDP-diacylglycerol--serine O-phosphatidyltransferase
VAPIGGVESPFGREFDSLADLVSFGVAPAFLVHRVVLRDVFELHPEIGWFIASVSNLPGTGGGKEFLGFPIPSAAGLVASLTLLIINLNEHEKTLGRWKYVPLIVLILLSAMMVSTVRYPSFKSLGLRSTSTFAKAIIAALFVGGILVIAGQRSVLRTAGYVLPVFFTAYLIYGFIRPRISRRIRHEIEEEDDEDEEGDVAGATGRE